MSRYTGPSWKRLRRLGILLSGTGKEISCRNYAPDDHGPNDRAKVSEYGQQLKEKQKLRWIFGLNERRFQNLLIRAGKIREGKRGVNFMALFERRLDNIVYRLGLALTGEQARQLINHGHTLIDGRRVGIPSYEVKVGQEISLRDKSKNLQQVKDVLDAVTSRPPFVSSDDSKMTGTLARLPERDEMKPGVDEALIVKWYNKKL